MVLPSIASVPSIPRKVTAERTVRSENERLKGAGGAGKRRRTNQVSTIATIRNADTRTPTTAYRPWFRESSRNASIILPRFIGTLRSEEHTSELQSRLH